VYNDEYKYNKLWELVQYYRPHIAITYGKFDLPNESIVSALHSSS